MSAARKAIYQEKDQAPEGHLDLLSTQKAIARREN